MHTGTPSSSSPALEDYYADERKALATESAVCAELRALGVATVFAEYDGVGDSGQIDCISYRNDSDPAQLVSVGAEVGERVDALLYALLEMRHGGWEINDGAFGTFSWNLVGGTIEHEHCQRFTDFETSMHRGFVVDAGEAP